MCPSLPFHLLIGHPPSRGSYPRNEISCQSMLRWRPGSWQVGIARRFALLITILSTAAALWPWGDFQGHTHWTNVGWIPFVSPPVRLRDIIGNVLLFMPMGAAVAVNCRPGRRLRYAVIGGLAVSFLGEWSQLYSHGRFPSATDLVCNGAGAYLGAALIQRRYAGR